MGTPIDLIDTHGRVLQVDDEVSTANLAQFGVITKIAPIMDPRAPKGLVQVRIITVHDVILEGGAPTMELTRVQTAAERYAKGCKPTISGPNGDSAKQPAGGLRVVVTDGD